MAYLYPDDGLPTKAENNSLTYPQLSALKQRAMHGDASAEIALTQLPAATQRLAVMLVDTFGNTITKAAKPKVTKAKKPKAPKTVITAKSEKAYFRAMLSSPDPVERETAWAALEK
jgi:hypothetical protein